MDKRQLGAHAELLAQAWLLECGYEVFSNVRSHGPVDIVALCPDTKEVVLVDVKTVNKAFYKGTPYFKASRTLTKVQECLGVLLLHVYWEDGKFHIGFCNEEMDNWLYAEGLTPVCPQGS